MNSYKLKNKVYTIPLNIPTSSVSKYKEVIKFDYSKIIEAIALCGDIAMFNQFFELVRLLNSEKGCTDNGYKKAARTTISRLEGLGFIGTNYLNRHKYLYLKQPAYAVAEGDYLTHRRANLKQKLKTDKFIQSITKLQNFIENDFVYTYSNLFNQLMHITNLIYEKIKSVDNIYGYNLEGIEFIINQYKFVDIFEFIDASTENTCKLGILRILWGELGREYLKISKIGQTISDTPEYLQVNVLDNGMITLHYVPNIVIYDSLRGLDFYLKQNTKYFKMFFNLSSNNTMNLKKNYINNNNLGPLHYNRIGYTVTLIGSDMYQLLAKKDILNKPFIKSDEYSPLVKQCNYVPIDISNYLHSSSSKSKNNEVFIRSNEVLDRVIYEFMEGGV